MKTLLKLSLLSAVLGINAFSYYDANYFRGMEHTISVQAKHIDIKDSNLDASNVYGISFIMHKDFGEQGEWGAKYGLELNYGKFDKKDSTDSITYFEASFMFAPTYTFDKVRIYGGMKVGYTLFGSGSDDSSSTGGNVLAGVFGADYHITKNFLIGAHGEIGKTYIDTEGFSTTTYGIYLGFSY